MISDLGHWYDKPGGHLFLKHIFLAILSCGIFDTSDSTTNDCDKGSINSFAVPFSGRQLHWAHSYWSHYFIMKVQMKNQTFW